MQIGTKRAVPTFLPIPDHVFEKLLEKYPRGKLPQVENCYYLLLTSRWGQPFVVPDFVINVDLPVGYKTTKKKDVEQLCGKGLAPLRGTRILQFMQDRSISSVESKVGFVAWLPNPDSEKPWLFSPNSNLIRNGGMPDFGYGDTIEDALRKFL